MKLKNDLIKDWIQKAEHDSGIAELALVNKPEYTDSICFHCQQTVEKYLKAYLVHLDKEFVLSKIHFTNDQQTTDDQSTD